jgi:hypothetical protein
MSSRAVVWALAILAVVLVVVPLLSMLGMMACCGGMGMGGMMRGSTNGHVRRWTDLDTARCRGRDRSGCRARSRKQPRVMPPRHVRRTAQDDESGDCRDGHRIPAACCDTPAVAGSYPKRPRAGVAAECSAAGGEIPQIGRISRSRGPKIRQFHIQSPRNWWPRSCPSMQRASRVSSSCRFHRADTRSRAERRAAVPGVAGMPAWSTGTKEGETASWHLVHFIRRLPKLTPEELADMESLNPKPPAEIRQQIAEEEFLKGGGRSAAAKTRSATQTLRRTRCLDDL